MSKKCTILNTPHTRISFDQPVIRANFQWKGKCPLQWGFTVVFKISFSSTHYFDSHFYLMHDNNKNLLDCGLISNFWIIYSSIISYNKHRNSNTKWHISTIAQVMSRVFIINYTLAKIVQMKYQLISIIFSNNLLLQMCQLQNILLSYNNKF